MDEISQIVLAADKVLKGYIPRWAGTKVITNGHVPVVYMGAGMDNGTRAKIFGVPYFDPFSHDGSVILMWRVDVCNGDVVSDFNDLRRAILYAAMSIVAKEVEDAIAVLAADGDEFLYNAVKEPFTDIPY